MMDTLKLFINGEWFLQPFSNCGFVWKLRHSLLRWIAGDCVVILNCKITVEGRVNNEFSVYCHDIGGVLMDNNYFDVPEDKQLTITKNNI